MKKLYVILILALFPFVALSQVLFDTYSYDFGTINEVDGSVEHTFAYTNQGEEPFSITSVSVECGCTTPTYSTTPLSKGQSAKFTVAFDPRDRPGRFEKQIFLRTDQKDIVLLIRGIVNPRPRTVEDDYPYLINSGVRINTLAINVDRASVGKPTLRSIGVVNTSNILSASIGVDESELPKWVRVVVPKIRLAPGEKGEIMLEFNALNFGLHLDEIPLIINGNRQAEKVWLSAVFTRDFSGMSPTEIRDGAKAEYSAYFYHFSTQKGGDKLVRSFDIRNVGQSELVIDHVEASSPDLNFSVGKRVLGVGEKTTLRVEARPSSDGIFSETVRVITSDVQNPVREIRIMANVI